MEDKLEIPDSFESKRYKNFPPDTFDPKKPRLGRRESEPHSDEINYLYVVLTTNFSDDRAIWDLHHYFTVDDINIDIQFDISFFRDMKIPKRLYSYKANEYDNRVPTMVVNILSKSTWRADIGEHVDYCRNFGIPLYIVFPAFHVATKYYKPPFLRVYILQKDGLYTIKELREITIDGENKNFDALIDISEYVPFRLGLEKRQIKHESGYELYRLILLKPEEFKVFLTKAEKTLKKLNETRTELSDTKTRLNEKEAKIQRLEEELKKLKE